MRAQEVDPRPYFMLEHASKVLQKIQKQATLCMALGIAMVVVFAHL